MEKKTCKVVKEPVKIYLNKKLDPKQNTIQTFNINAQWLKKKKNENPLTWEIGVTRKPVPANLPMVGRSTDTG